MSKSISNVSFRIDTQLKKDADELFQSLGLTMTSAFNLFLRQSVREGGIPFMITTHVPNRETLSAIEEGERLAKDPSAKRFDNVDDLFKDLDK